MAGNVVDLHREVSISLLKSSTGYAVKTPRGQKEPGHFRWDPMANSRANSEKVIYEIERSDDNLGIHLHGRVVDVDVDTDNPILSQALDYFLPPTSHIWGRKSRPRTHRLYELTGANDQPFDPSEFPFLETLKKNSEIQLEIRGGHLKSGQYSLLPGSLHPSGESYQWEDVSKANSTPASVDLFRVLNGVRFASVASIIAPFWTEGQRNQMCMALSGFLHRAAAHAKDMGAMSQIYFEKADAKKLLEGVLKLADDDASDYAMRIRTFEQTWEKAEKGVPVQGATALMKMTGRDDLISLLYSLLVDSPDLRAFDEFMERYAMRNNTSNVIDRRRVGVRGAVSLMTVNDFRNSYMHKNITTGSGERRSMTAMLLASERAIRVEGLAFVPGGEEMVEKEGGKYINQWSGYAIPPYEGEVVDADVEPVVRYIREVVCNGNEKAFQWVYAWIADMFKNPQSKPGTALVLVGKPGSGKSFLGSEVVRRIIGHNHTMQTNNIESLTGQFNSDSQNMLFIQCDEALNSRRHADANKLKSMITDKTRRIEPKNINAYEIEDVARYLMTSNEINDAVAIVDGQNDRRYTVIHVNESYSSRSDMNEDHRVKFWNDLYAWVEVESNMAKLHRHLLMHEYDRALIRKPLETKARNNIQQHSQRGFDDWLMQIVYYEHPLESLIERDQRTEESYIRKEGKWLQTIETWPDMISYRRLEESYDLYRRKKGMSSSTASYNAQQIKQEFVSRGLLPPECPTARLDHREEQWKNGSPVVITRKIRISAMPSKNDILAHLGKQFGFSINHGVETDLGVEEKTDDTKTPDY